MRSGKETRQELDIPAAIRMTANRVAQVRVVQTSCMASLVIELSGRSRSAVSHAGRVTRRQRCKTVAVAGVGRGYGLL